MKSKYQSGDTINNKAGLSLQVQSSRLDPIGKQGRKVTNYVVTCEECGHQLPPTKAASLEDRKACPGCEEKPPALKTDSTSTCISICEIGSVEFIRQFQADYGVSERAAVRYFIESIQAHLLKDDPIIGKRQTKHTHSGVNVPYVPV